MFLLFWPVNNVERVKITDGARHLGSIEPRSGLGEASLSLQVEEQLQRHRMEMEGGREELKMDTWRENVSKPGKFGYIKNMLNKMFEDRSADCSQSTVSDFMQYV